MMKVGDPEPEVPILLYIGRRGRVIERAIGLIDCFLICCSRLILAIIQIRPSRFALDLHGRPCQPLQAFPLTVAGPIAWW
jgi:hypothetical protein